MKEENNEHSKFESNELHESVNQPKHMNKRQTNVFDGDYFSREYLVALENKKRENSINEFRYHSIRDDLKRKEQELNVKPARKKLFEDYIQPTYRDVYDLDKLESIQAYDQFKTESKDENQSEINTQDTSSDKVLESSLQSNLIKKVQDRFFAHKDVEKSQIEAYDHLSDVNDSSKYDSSTINEETPSMSKKLTVDLSSMKDKLFNSPKELLKSFKTNVDENKDIEDFNEIIDSNVDELIEPEELVDAWNGLSEPKTIKNEQIDEDLEQTIVLAKDELIQGKTISSEDEIENFDNVEQKNESVHSDAIHDEEESKIDLEETIVLNREELEEQFESEQDLEQTILIPRDQLQKTSQQAAKEHDLEHTIVLNPKSIKIQVIDEEMSSTKTMDENERRLDEHPLFETKVYQSPIIRDTNFEDTLTYEDLMIDQEVNRQIHDSSDAKHLNPTEKEDSESTFVKGAAWMSIGTVISRIIGALYVIPWATWFGESWTKANTLFSAGYKPYGLFLAVATGGFPSAISKQMAYYTTQKRYKTADKLFKNSLLVMIGTGLVSGLILFLAAPFLAENTSVVDTEGATWVIRSLAPALFILPTMSLLRGYFQGFSDMKPTAVSQIIEQIARVVYMLVATYSIMILAKGQAVDAVVQSTFAAFIGAAIALLYLIWIYIRRYGQFKQLVEQDTEEVSINLQESIKILLKDSIPFIILGSGIIIAQNIDTYTFGHILRNTSYLLMTEIEILYGVLSLDVDKLIMIIVSLAIALSASSIPLLTSSFSKGDLAGTRRLLEKILSVFFLVMLPSAFGMAAIADNLYWLFYPGGSEFGPAILVTAALSSIILGLYSVLSITLQSMSFRRHAVKFLLIGLLVKLLLQYPFVALWNAHGAILTTTVGLAVTCVLMAIKIHKEVKLDMHSITNTFIRVLIPTIIMGVAAFLWNSVINSLFGPVGRLVTFGKIIIVVILALFIYGTLMALQGMLSILIGNKFADIQEKLRYRR